MCQCYIISSIQYLLGIHLDPKSSNNKLENNIDSEEISSKPKFTSTLRRKSSHHLNVDYETELVESEELMENKENITSNSSPRFSKKAISEYKMIFIEKNIKIHCECCKREIIREQIIYRMMDKYFCSEYCRYRTFPPQTQTQRFSIIR